jgi:hypothetical protein
MSAQHGLPWCRPQASFDLSVGCEGVARSNAHLRRLVGYGIRPPFMDFVRGLHPKRLMEPFNGG